MPSLSLTSPLCQWALLGALALGLGSGVPAYGQAHVPPARAKIFVPGFHTYAAPLPSLPTKVMCIGDSNTHGVQGHTSYRYPLWFQLYQQRAVLDFVGTRFTVHNENGVTIPDLNQYSRYYTYFDRDHQAYNGIRSDQIVPLLGQAVSLTRPDIVLLMIGTNDIGQLGSGGVNNALHGIMDIVHSIRLQAPATTFLIANLPPIGPGTAFFNNAAHINTFNNQLPGVVANLDDPLSRAVFVDVHAVLDLQTDFLPDGLHPNFVGQAKVANAFYPAVISAISGSYRPMHLASVQLLDSSFESLGLADQAHSQQELTDWLYHTEPNLLRGVWNPDNVTYPGALGAGTPTGAEGDEVLALENIGGDPARAWITQIMPTTLERDKLYTVSVAIGHRAPGGSRGFSNFGGYEIQLLAGNRIIASSSNQVTPQPGTFETDTIVFDSTGAHQSIEGTALSIRLRQTYQQYGVGTDFDDVRLSVQ